MGKRMKHDRNSKLQPVNKTQVKNHTDTIEGNRPDFYLDDADADLAEEVNEKDIDMSSSEEHGSELDFNEEDYQGEDDENEENGGDEKKIKEAKITKEELKRIIKKATNGSEFAMTRIIIIFGKITNPNVQIDTIAEDNILTNTKVANRLISYCVETLPEILLMKMNSGKISASAKNLARRYVSMLSRFLKSSDGKMQSFILKHMESMTDLLIPFNNFIEVIAKSVIKIWSEDPFSETSQNCLKLIKNILSKKPVYFECFVKIFYINYLEISKAMNLKSKNAIEKLQNDMIDILSIDYQKAYLTIFSFIRKLCLQLRATIVAKTSSSIKTIYNWQFINSLILWSRVIIKYYTSKSDINLLAYPLIQTILGVIRLNFVDTFFPLRLILVNQLNEISLGTGIFIPIAIYVFEILESSLFTLKKSKKDKTLTQNDRKAVYHLNTFTNLKLKKEELQTHNVIQELLEECMDSLFEYCAINSHKVSSCDIIFGVSHHIRKVMKRVIDKGFKDIMRNTLEKIEGHSEYMKNKVSTYSSPLTLISPQSLTLFEDEVKKDDNCKMTAWLQKIHNKRHSNLQEIEYQAEDKFIEI